MAEACEECTNNCLLMHKRDKKSSSVATTFFKVMFADDYSKILLLPPKFARSLQDMVGKTTELEDSNGERWTVKYSKVNGLLAFQEGWNTFSEAHELKIGDFLVFHHIRKSHFVVLMYGESGCPEIRHLVQTSKTRKLITADHSLSNVNANNHELSCQSSSQSERSVYGVNEPPETRLSTGTLRRSKKKKMKEKTSQERSVSATVSPDVNTTNTDHPMFVSSSLPGAAVSERKTSQERSVSATMSPDVNTTNTDHPMFMSSSLPGAAVSERKTSQRYEPLVSNTDLDNLVSEVPTMKQCSLVNNDTGNVEDERRRNDSNDVLIPEVNSNESDGGCENNVAVGGGGDETEINESGKVLETRSEKLKKRLKERTEKPRAPTYNNSIKKRLRGANVTVAGAKKAKIEPSETVVLDSGLHDVGGSSDSTGFFRRRKGAKTAKIEPSETVVLDSTLHDVGGPSDSRRRIVMGIKSIKKEITMNRGSNGRVVNDTKTAGYNTVEEEESPTVKPEPIDYDDAPPSGTTNTSFSAVMCTYKYLELPEWVNLKSSVILLRNALDLWPLLYQDKVGLKALTGGWELFARERGIQPGDVCEFVLESGPKSRFTCNVFTVHVTRE